MSESDNAGRSLGRIVSELLLAIVVLAWAAVWVGAALSHMAVMDTAATGWPDVGFIVVVLVVLPLAAWGYHLLGLVGHQPETLPIGGELTSS